LSSFAAGGGSAFVVAFVFALALLVVIPMRKIVRYLRDVISTEAAHAFVSSAVEKSAFVVAFVSVLAVLVVIPIREIVRYLRDAFRPKLLTLL
jgi:heme exporter protein D